MSNDHIKPEHELPKDGKAAKPHQELQQVHEQLHNTTSAERAAAAKGMSGEKGPANWMEKLAAEKPENQFSPGLGKGHGPYHALQQQHKDWDHKQILDEAHRITKAVGDNPFHQGDQFRINEGGSVTVRGKAHEGNYKESTYSDGKLSGTTEHIAEKDGNFREIHRDQNGQQVSETKHVQEADGSFKEITTDMSGKQLSLKEHKVNGNGASVTDSEKDSHGYTNRTTYPDGHQTGASVRDGHMSTFKRDVDGVSTETHYRASGSRESVETKKPDGSMSVVGYDSKGNVNRTLEVRPDHSSSESTVDASGSTIVREKAANGAVTLKELHKDGTVTETRPDANLHAYVTDTKKN